MLVFPEYSENLTSVHRSVEIAYRVASYRQQAILATIWSYVGAYEP